MPLHLLVITPSAVWYICVYAGSCEPILHYAWDLTVIEGIEICLPLNYFILLYDFDKYFDFPLDWPKLWIGRRLFACYKAIVKLST